MNRLVLIDGNAILHRAYHALPPLTSADGSPAGAVYGFISMLIKIFRDLKPTHIAVAFDRAAPTFRKALFKEYQAKRPKMEDELVSQVDKVHEVLAAFGIPIFEYDGFEADDIIGTLAKRSIDQVIIVTGDRDLLQLVQDDKVYCYMPTKGLSEAKLFDEAAVKEKMGVEPNKIPDFKALAGDASDNYPGVPGIGPKTAVKLLEKHQTIQNIVKTLTEKQRESALLSHQLATIRTDAPIVFDQEKSRIDSLDSPEARKALSDLHFPSLIKRLSNREEKKKLQKKLPGEQRQLF